MKLPRTTAIIVTFNSADRVGEALAAAFRSHESGLLDVVVVDNASTDESAALVRREHPWAKLIVNRANIGYGRGLNAGLCYVSTPYVLFMNPDVVLELEALRTLVEFMEEHPLAGIIAPAIRRAAGNWQSVSPCLTPRALVSEAAGWRRRPPQPILPEMPPFQTEWLCGAVLLCRKPLVDELGGFDPRFFLYFEETDLCRRARMAGHELWAVGQAVATHASNSSARKVQPDLPDGGCLVQHFYRSRFYYLVKHHGWVCATLAEVAELLLKAGRDGARFVLAKASSKELASRLRGPVLRLPWRVE